jgi:hypothetical protein
MHFNPGALLVFVGFGVLVALGASSNGGAWFRRGEAVSTVVIVAGASGFLSGRRSRER